MVKVGQRVEVRVIKIDTDERKIGLTLIQAHFEEGAEGTPAASTTAEPEAAAAAAMPMLGSLADQLKGIGARVSEREADGAPEAAAPAAEPAPEAAAESAPASEEAKDQE